MLLVADTPDTGQVTRALDAAGIPHSSVRVERDHAIVELEWIAAHHIAPLAAALPDGVRVVLTTDDDAHPILDAWPAGADVVIIATPDCYRTFLAAGSPALPTGFRQRTVRVGDTPMSLWHRNFAGAARPDSFDYDVAISFAGRDRQVAREIVDVVAAAGYRVFYDYDDQHTLLGEDLAQYLQDVYFRRSRFAVVVLSKAYTESSWAGNWEWRAVLARMQAAAQPYLLPYALDDTVIPGLNPTVGHVTRDRCTPAEFGALVLRKLRGE